MKPIFQEKITFLIEDTLPKNSKKKIHNWAAALSKTVGGVNIEELKMLGNENNSEIKAAISGSDCDRIVFIFEPITPRTRFTSKFVDELSQNKDSDVIFFDSREVQRPEFSPERLRGQNYLGPFVIFKREAINEIPGLSFEFGTTSLWSLTLRLFLQKKVISHGKTHIFHEAFMEPREVTLQESEYIRNTIHDFLDQPNGGECVEVISSELFPSRRFAQTDTLISIIIPTRGTKDPHNQKPLLIRTIESVESTTKHLNVEYVVVVDEGYDSSVIQELEEIAGPRLKLVLWNEAFNFSKKMNLGFVHSQGEFILLLNDDIEVISKGWLEALLSLAQLPNAGMVGAMLYYEDGTIQHAGHAYYHGSPTHIGLNAPRGSKGPRGALLVERELSGVTAACAMMPREVFERVGGFSALLPGNFNDVDLCLKVGWAGYDVYWTPFAELFHFESKTRDAHVHYYELDIIAERWGPRLADNRFWPGSPQAI